MSATVHDSDQPPSRLDSFTPNVAIEPPTSEVDDSEKLIRHPSRMERFMSKQEQEGLPDPSPPNRSLLTEPLSTDRSAEPSRPESPAPDAAIEPPQSRVKVYHPLAPEVLIMLMPGSVFGVLARLGLVGLNTYPGQGIFPLAWVQGIGCVIMGVVVGYRDQITSFHPPLYAALATGFCGSLTTFSSWMLDVFMAFSDAERYDRLWINDVMDGLTRTFGAFAVSLCGLSLGLHIASYGVPRTRFRLHRPSHFVRIAFIFACFVVWLLTIPLYFATSHSFRPLATSALIFSFPGTLLRHILGTQLNGRHPYWPIGTFLANAIATALLAIFHALQRLSSSPPPLSCVTLQGLIDGLCGCLSTVSTFAVEVRGMQGRGKEAKVAWAYAVGSWATGQLLMVAILGGAMWSGRVSEADMCTFTVSAVQ